MNRIEIANGSLSFACDVDDTILSGGLRAGLGLAHECLSGGCGKCYFDLVEGSIEEAWNDAPGLSARARERGRHLACQTLARSDCRIKLRPDPKFVPPIAPKRRIAVLSSRRSLAPGMTEFTFHAEGDADFLPGQFALMRLPGVVGRRAYSMSNLANPNGKWEFIVRRVPAGAGTAFLFDELAEGSEIEIDGPYGHAYLRTDSKRDIVCIAGGSGLSPIVSIARGAVRADAMHDRNIKVFYGGRGPRDICTTTFWEEDEALQMRAECHVSISDPAAEGAEHWTGNRGFIHEVVQAVLKDRNFAEFEYYLCGPAPMVEALVNLLAAQQGVPREQIHFDSFF